MEGRGRIGRDTCLLDVAQAVRMVGWMGGWDCGVGVNSKEGVLPSPVEEDGVVDEVDHLHGRVVVGVELGSWAGRWRAVTCTGGGGGRGG